MTAEEQLQCEHHEHGHHCGGCGHHHTEPELPGNNVVSLNVGGGIALCKVTTYGKDVTVSCNLELDGVTLAASCLSAALQGVAYDAAKLDGAIEQVTFAPEDERLDEDSEINFTISATGVDREDLLEILSARLERIL